MKKLSIRSLLTSALFGIAAVGSLGAMNGDKDGKAEATNQHRQLHCAACAKHSCQQHGSVPQLASSSAIAYASSNTTPTPFRGMALDLDFEQKPSISPQIDAPSLTTNSSNNTANYQIQLLHTDIDKNGKERPIYVLVEKPAETKQPAKKLNLMTEEQFQELSEFGYSHRPASADITPSNRYSPIAQNSPEIMAFLIGPKTSVETPPVNNLKHMLLWLENSQNPLMFSSRHMLKTFKDLWGPSDKWHASYRPIPSKGQPSNTEIDTIEFVTEHSNPKINQQDLQNILFLAAGSNAYTAANIILATLKRLNVPLTTIRDAAGNNALHFASEQGDVNMRRLILAYDATLDAQQNNAGQTPYQLCSRIRKLRSHLKESLSNSLSLSVKTSLILAVIGHTLGLIHNLRIIPNFIIDQYTHHPVDVLLDRAIMTYPILVFYICLTTSAALNSIIRTNHEPTEALFSDKIANTQWNTVKTTMLVIGGFVLFATLIETLHSLSIL